MLWGGDGEYVKGCVGRRVDVGNCVGKERESSRKLSTIIEKVRSAELDARVDTMFYCAVIGGRNMNKERRGGVERWCPGCRAGGESHTIDPLFLLQ